LPSDGTIGGHMIVAEQKPLEEINALLGERRQVLVVGCGTCVTVCFAGGEKEATILASALRMSSRMEGKPRQISVSVVQRQCEWEYIDAIREPIQEADCILSLGCGVGAQALAERFPDKIVIPGLNTSFMGLPVEQGVWSERCQACGNCLLALTGGVCPIARCSKQLLNGPCGGSVGGHCEVNPEIDCAWQLIYDRLKAQGRLEMLLEIQPPKDWRTSRDGGPRKIVREDLRLENADDEPGSEPR